MRFAYASAPRRGAMDSNDEVCGFADDDARAREGGCLRLEGFDLGDVQLSQFVIVVVIQ